MAALRGRRPLHHGATDGRRVATRRRGRRQRSACAAALALCALAAGSACAPAGTRKAPRLAPAGSARDEGRGVLARLSTGRALNPPPAAARARSAPRAGATDERRTDDRGMRYGNYRFDRAPRPHHAPLPYARRYVPFAPTEWGTIEGVVQWPSPPRAPERLRPRSTAPGRAGPCSGGPLNRSLAIGAGAAVANAVVYLEDVATGRMLLGRVNSSYPNPTKHMQVGGVLEWRACRFHPQVQVVAPVGSVLSLTTADEAIEVSALRVDGREREPAWRVPLEAFGTAHEHLLDREGIFELRADAADHSASAWVVVAPHPYYAVTDDRGRFVLDQIPPGSYMLVVWHSPVVVGFTRSGESVTQVTPMVRRKVVVRARQGQRVHVRLPPAP